MLIVARGDFAHDIRVDDLEEQLCRLYGGYNYFARGPFYDRSSSQHNSSIPIWVFFTDGSDQERRNVVANAVTRFACRLYSFGGGFHYLDLKSLRLGTSSTTRSQGEFVVHLHRSRFGQGVAERVVSHVRRVGCDGWTHYSAGNQEFPYP
jgi:hypothetical protein